MRKTIRFALATAIVLGTAVATNAQSVMKQCGEQWQAAKLAGTTNGETWPQFLAQCRAQLSSGPATAAPTPLPPPSLKLVPCSRGKRRPLRLRRAHRPLATKAS